ncbi:hypothetical protein BDQ17DRAFT_490017 [Cyathus striatus]|nr:hypothetical protein BDQ17DRAFT_490017 [Cyathus striatus]
MEHAKPLESKKRRRASTCCYFRELLNEIPSEVIPISLARSNHVPSTSDRPTIEALVSTSDTSIRTLKAALINIRSVYEDLYVRLENIREYNDVQRSLLSPIRRLPDELLANIFAYVYGGKISILTKSHGQIWDLQQVCIRWRNLAQSTPLLWNNFEVGIRRIDDPAIMERRIRACLKFSNPAPLSMVLLPTNIYMFFSALGSIADQAHRWRSLTVDGRTIQPVVTMGIVMTFIERVLSMMFSRVPQHLRKSR